MGKIIPTSWTRFDGGMTNTYRAPEKRFARVSKHFDILTAAYKLTPFLSMEADGSTGDTEQIVKFVSANSKQYGLGVVSGTARVKIFERASLPNGAWSASTTGFDAGAGGGTRSKLVFVEYNDVLYGLTGGTAIWTYAYLTSTFTVAAQAVTYTNAAQAIVHSKDGILYLPYDNKIASKNGAGAWNLTALTLPANSIITCISEYGNYLAIATKSNYIGGKSVVYLWDRDSSLATLSEKIDWGTEIIQYIEELEGVLIGVSNTTATSSSITPKVVFKYYAGASGAKVFDEFLASSTTILFADKQKINGRFYFMMSLQINGVQHDGVWSIGRAEQGDDLAVSLDRLLNNDTALSCIPEGFQLLGDYMTVAYRDSGVFVINITNDNSLYSATSLYETTIHNLGDSSVKKKLVRASLTTEALPTAGIASLKYRIDGGTSWVQIMSNSTDSSMNKDALRINNLTAGGDTVTVTIATPAVVSLTAHKLVSGQKVKFSTTGALPTGIDAGVEYFVRTTGLTADAFQISATLGGSAVNTSGSQSGTHTMDRSMTFPDYREIEFQINSTGGAVITGLHIEEEIIDKKI